MIVIVIVIVIVIIAIIAIIVTLHQNLHLLWHIARKRAPVAIRKLGKMVNNDKSTPPTSVPNVILRSDSFFQLVIGLHILEVARVRPCIPPPPL